MKVQSAVELGGDVEVAHGELVNARASAAAERRGVANVTSASTLNDTATEVTKGASVDDISFGESVFAGPALEVEAGVI